MKHHLFSKGLSSSKRNHPLNGGRIWTIFLRIKSTGQMISQQVWHKVVGIKFIRKPTEGQFHPIFTSCIFFFRLFGIIFTSSFFSQKTYNPMKMDMIIIIIIIMIMSIITIIIIIMNHPHPHLLNNQAVTRRLKQRLPGSKADVGNVILHMSKPFLFWKVVLKHSKTSRKMFFLDLPGFFVRLGTSGSSILYNVYTPVILW